MQWVILVNRKLAKETTYGPFTDYYEACNAERLLARETWVKSTLVSEVHELRIEDGHIVRTAYL